MRRSAIPLLYLILILVVQPVLGSVSDCADNDSQGDPAGHHQMAMGAGPDPVAGVESHHGHQQPESHDDRETAPDSCCGADCDCPAGVCSSAVPLSTSFADLFDTPKPQYSRWNGAVDVAPLFNIFRPPIPV